MDDGVYYNFSTSIPHEFFPTQSESVRVKNYFCIFIIWDELNNFFILILLIKLMLRVL